MAPSFLSSLLTTLLLTHLATSTFNNPSLPATHACLPPTTPNKPAPTDCVAATLTLPYSHHGIDYHPERPGPGPARVVYDTALSSTGDPASPYHLPRTTQSGSCRITVSIAEGLHFARVLWIDVRDATVALVRSCVRDPGGALGTVAGAGAGGRTSVGAISVTVEYVGPEAGPGGPGAEKPGEGGWRIGAYYPPRVRRARLGLGIRGDL